MDFGGFASPEWLALSKDDDERVGRFLTELPAMYSLTRPHRKGPAGQPLLRVEPRPVGPTVQFREQGNFVATSLAELQRLLDKRMSTGTQ